ncbi:MAG: serine/threonine protein kinase [Deltaproteobacteria bacterium]|nr:serine/threonine protein kinase [Deltaproteobacteria bacterium]
MEDLGRLGKYELLKRLATGGMAEIFLARQTGVEGFEKLVVIKRILPHLADQDRFVTMFLDEARLAARFNHSNVVQIYDLGHESGFYFIAMEYVHGEDIKSVVRRCAKQKQRIPIEHVIKIFSGVLAGLHYAHNQKDLEGRQHGVVHRDVSPHNIILSFQGDVKLVDFGIAKARSEISTTIPGRVKGKHAYMSPEQIHGDQELDGRSDVFSVGIVMYELLTWTRLFKRKTDLDTLKAAVGAPIRPLRELNPDLDPELDDIVLKALERDRDRRYQSAQEMQAQCEDFLLRKGLRSNQILLSQFMSDLFAEKLAAMNRALDSAQAASLETAVLKARNEGPDLVAFLDMFFADTGSTGGSGLMGPDGPSAPEFTPSGEYTPASQAFEFQRKRSEIPARVRGEYMPRKAPPPRVPDSMDLFESQLRGAASQAPGEPMVDPGMAPGFGDEQAPQPFPPSDFADEYEYVDCEKYSDVIEPMGKKRGKGFIIFVLLVLVAVGGGLLLKYKDELSTEHKPEFGVVKVSSVPGGADVYFDDVLLPSRTPTDIGKIEPGKEHSLKVSLPGLPAWEEKFTLTDTTKPMEFHAVLSASEAQKARMKGKPIVAGAEGKGTGSIRVTSQPARAMIYLDGIETRHKTPHKLTGVPAGLDHVVMVALEGKPPAFERLHLEDGKTAELSLKLDGEVDLPDRVTVHIESEPEGAKVTVNGFTTERYRTPMAVKLLASSPSELLIEADGHQKWTRNVRPIPDVDLTFYAQLKKGR